jgi:hypothetical protein
MRLPLGYCDQHKVSITGNNKYFQARIVRLEYIPIFGSKREEVSKDNIKLRNYLIHDLYFNP